MADKTANKLQVSFRVTPETRRALDLKLAADDRLQTELMNALVADYLGGARSPERLRQPANERWHRIVDEVLALGKKDAFDLITQNLLLAERMFIAENTEEKRTKKRE